jgi:prepilin-type N-terminal cleavage/methylation domain-containing protein
MSGYTLIEMVLALAITSTLLVGMSASIVIASRTVSDGLDVVGLALRTADVLGEINSDLSMAEAFAERSDSAVTFCVPDRDGDGQSDVLRYWWTGSGDKRLMKQINSGPEIALAEDVRQFSLTYGVSTMAAKSPSDYDDDDSDRRWNGRRRRVGWGKFWDHRGHGWGHYDFMPGNGHGNGNGNGHGNGHNSGQGHWECGGGTSDDDIAPPGSAWREGWTGPGSDDDDSGNGNGNGNGGNSSDDDDDDDDSSNNGKGNGKGGGKK